MLPTTWRPCRRLEDDELLGYAEDRADGTVPLTLFGVPLAGPGTPEEAEEVLRSRGLASLAEPWLLREAGGEEVRVAVLTAYADRVVVVPAPYGYADPTATPRVVPAEDGAVLLRPYA